MRRKGWIGKSLLSFLAALVLPACSDAGPPEPVKPVRFAAPPVSDLETVWKNALVAIPVRGTTGSLLTTNEGRAGPPQKLAGVGPEEGLGRLAVEAHGPQAVELQAVIDGLEGRGVGVVGAMYFAMCWPLSLWGRRIERRMSAGLAR